ncbi:ATP synthase F1 [Fusarium globosum]|uniref:ATP synthase F1 n=1 Tax=Fusarium globosum TaxID=78864 RepID=A0A8H6D552_9HYPO|nr:ATP synthase F1 [Fusarium globosum]
MEQTGSEKVIFWELDPSVQQPIPAPNSVEPCIRTSGVTDIGIFTGEQDIRTPVDEMNFQPGGKYHSIVKLFICSEASKAWTTATGWLLENDLVVTAAHCVLLNDQHASCVRVCIGYSASSGEYKDSDALRDNQRLVARIALPFAWGDAKFEQSDVAFLQLDRPFHNVVPIACSTPEIKAQQRLTVVGYPADLGTAAEGPGGEMYEFKISQDMDLERSRRGMLGYHGDTHGGLSGAPVIRESDCAAIGVHVRGGSLNSAVVIGGPFGVDFQIYKDVLRSLRKGGDPQPGFQIEPRPDREWLKVVHLTK